MTTKIWSRKSLVAAIALVLLAVPVAMSIPLGGNGGSNDPAPAANKTAAAGATIEVLPSELLASPLGTTILETTMKTSRTDLIFQVTLECALWTQVQSTTILDHPEDLTPLSRAEARILVWVEVNGVPVKVASDDPDGKVVFCDRVHEQEITDMDDSTGNFTVRQYLETRTANAFNWALLDVGPGVHSIVVKAELEAMNTEGAFAEGAVGKRMLIVETTRFAQGTSLW